MTDWHKLVLGNRSVEEARAGFSKTRQRWQHEQAEREKALKLEELERARRESVRDEQIRQEKAAKISERGHPHPIQPLVEQEIHAAFSEFANGLFSKVTNLTSPQDAYSEWHAAPLSFNLIDPGFFDKRLHERSWEIKPPKSWKPNAPHWGPIVKLPKMRMFENYDQWWARCQEAEISQIAKWQQRIDERVSEMIARHPGYSAVIEICTNLGWRFSASLAASRTTVAEADEYSCGSWGVRCNLWLCIELAN